MGRLIAGRIEFLELYKLDTDVEVPPHLIDHLALIVVANRFINPLVLTLIMKQVVDEVELFTDRVHNRLADPLFDE